MVGAGGGAVGRLKTKKRLEGFHIELSRPAQGPESARPRGRGPKPRARGGARWRVAVPPQGVWTPPWAARALAGRRGGRLEGRAPNLHLLMGN